MLIFYKVMENVLMNNFGIHITFAHQTFKWTSETKNKAAVYCVIIGFSLKNKEKKNLYVYSTLQSEPEKRIVENISPYLFAGQDCYVTAQKNALCDVPKMNFGNQPRDGGNFVLSVDDYEQLLQVNPAAAEWTRPYIGADEFIKGKKRYCLWLKHISPTELKKNK